MAALTPADGNKILDAELRAVAYTGPASLFAGLHIGDPGTTGANEITGGSYVRQAVAFGASAGEASASSNAQTFNGMPATPVTTLAAPVTAIATTITTTSAVGFPVAGQYKIIVDTGVNLEKMLVTGGFGTTTLTVTRGIDGTAAVTHLLGVAVAGTVCFLSLWDANAAGAVHWAGPATPATAYGAGDTASLPIGAVVATIV